MVDRVQKTNRTIFKCGICSKAKDLTEGRILPLIITKGGLNGPKTVQDNIWVCSECLPWNEEEIESQAVAMAYSIPGPSHEAETRFLYRLALTAPKGLIFVDLGTHQGRTAAILCAAARRMDSRVLTIDNYTQDIIFQECRSLEPADYAWAVEDRLSGLGFTPHVVVGDSAVLPADVGSISLLFIDTEHTRERLYKELDAWLPLLVRSGILVLHDYPNFDEMKLAIDKRIRSNVHEWRYLGLTAWTIAFRRLREHSPDSEQRWGKETEKEEAEKEEQQCRASSESLPQGIEGIVIDLEKVYKDKQESNHNENQSHSE